MARAQVRSGKGGVASKTATRNPAATAPTQKPPTPAKTVTPKAEPLRPTGSACSHCGSVLHDADWHEGYEPPEDEYEETLRAAANTPRAKSMRPPPPAGKTAASPSKTAAPKPTATAGGKKPPPTPPAKPTKAAPGPPPPPHRSWQSKLARGKDGGLKPTAHNAGLILNYDPHWMDAFAYNEFKECPVTTKKPPWHMHQHLIPPGGIHSGEFTDEDTLRALSWLAMEYQLYVTDAVAFQGIKMAAGRRVVHPVRDWLRALPPYPQPLIEEAHKAIKSKAKKKVPPPPPPSLIDTWLVRVCGCEDTPYIRAVGAKFLIGLVARVMKPGCKLDTMPVFEGPQGALKSQMLRVLIEGRIDAGLDWFTDTGIELGTKDSYQMLRGKWLIEQAELASMKRTDHLHMKQFMSQQVDTYRPSYGRQTVDKKRQCGFCATTNDETYLKDDTGARRYWPVPVGIIDLELLKREREPMWAEAVARYDAGEKWWFDTPELQAAHAEMVEARRAADPFEWRVAKWLAGLPIDRQYTGVSTNDVIELWQPIDTQAEQQGAKGARRPVDWGRTNRSDEQRASGLLLAAGWRHKRRVALTGGGRQYRYSLYPRESVDIFGDNSIVERGTGRVIRAASSGSNLRVIRPNVDEEPIAVAKAANAPAAAPVDKKANAKTNDKGKGPAGAKTAKTTKTTKTAKTSRTVSDKVPAGAVRNNAKGTAGGRSRSGSSGTGRSGSPSIANINDGGQAIPTITRNLGNPLDAQREQSKRDVLDIMAPDEDYTTQAIAQALPEGHPLFGRPKAVETVLTWLRVDGHVTGHPTGKYTVYRLK